MSTDSPEQNTGYYEELLRRSDKALVEALTVTILEDPTSAALKLFPAPNERRADDEGLELTEQQEATLRGAAAELGFGRETDINLSEIGLGDACVYIEGGQPHKVVAEAQLVLADTTAQPKAIIFGGSHREITNPNEQASATRLNVSANTEYEMVRNVIGQLDDVELLPDEEILPFSYDIQQNFNVGNKPNGQLAKLGTVRGIDVLMLRLDREDYINEAGEDKYRKQPSTTDVMQILHDTMASAGDTTTPIAYVTSATYGPSRQIDGARVSLTTGRIVGCSSYGTARLAEVKGEPTPALAPINQLPGELYRLAQETQKLRDLLYGPNTEV